MIKEMYKTLDMNLRIELSFRDDSDKYFGDKKLWEDAESTIESIAKEQELDYELIRGEAAFYGPKIDIHILDALNRSWQCATVQLDFVMPERFDLEYASTGGDKERPAMIHKAILGSIERFLSVYIEHTAGRFPVWLAPEQIRIITLNQTDEIVALADSILNKSRGLGLRAGVDNDNESVGKKIRVAEVMKVPYVLVIGPKEAESGKVLPRVRQDLNDTPLIDPIDIDDFLNSVRKEHSDRSIKSSL